VYVNCSSRDEAHAQSCDFLRERTPIPPRRMPNPRLRARPFDFTSFCFITCTLRRISLLLSEPVQLSSSLRHCRIMLWLLHYLTVLSDCFLGYGIYRPSDRQCNHHVVFFNFPFELSLTVTLLILTGRASASCSSPTSFSPPPSLCARPAAPSPCVLSFTVL
jgi:hypothetical protein